MKFVIQKCYEMLLFIHLKKKTVGNECFFESDFEAEGQVMRFELKGFPVIFSH